MGFRSFEIDACELMEDSRGTDVAARCGESGRFWWDKPAFEGLDGHGSRQLRWVRRKHLVYDYCQDNLRFSDQLPGESSLIIYREFILHPPYLARPLVPRILMRTCMCHGFRYAESTCW